MAYKFVQLYDKNSVPTFPVKGPSCGGIFDQEDGTAYWYKFATIKLTTQFVDMTVLFHISKTYSNYADGTLLVHVRQDNSPATTLSGILMEWISMSQNIRPKNYAYVSTTGQVDLYYKRTQRWEDYHVEILKGDSRNNSNYSVGGNVTLYSHNNATGVTSLSGTVGYSYCGFYKVGDIICTTNATDPSTYYGGTWAKITDRFLVGMGSTYTTAGGTGGASSTTLTSANIPEHAHSIAQHNHWWGATSSSAGDHSHHVGTYNLATGGYEAVRPSGWSYQSSGRYTEGVGGHTHWSEGWTSTNGATATGNWGAASPTAISRIPPYYAVYFWRRTA
jgi:hypothetical protein